MKKKLLLTGATGFIGRNIKPYLEQCYEIIAPKRDELNIIDENNVDDYFSKNKFDVVIHSANLNPVKNPLDSVDKMLDYTMRGFLNIEKHSDKFGKLLYLGSGAEYNKAFDLKMVKEEEIGRSVPSDSYGYAKYILNRIASNSKNIYNLRIFGCYGPTDAKSKFIRDAIDCCLEDKAVTIRQNCMFDYMYVEDLAKIICWFVENQPKHNDYNICTGQPIDLVSIAHIVNRQMSNNKSIIVSKDGWNKEYTADNSRLMSEIADFKFTSIEEGIAKQIAWQKEYENEKARS